MKQFPDSIENSIRVQAEEKLTENAYKLYFETDTIVNILINALKYRSVLTFNYFTRNKFDTYKTGIRFNFYQNTIYDKYGLDIFDNFKNIVIELNSGNKNLQSFSLIKDMNKSEIAETAKEYLKEQKHDEKLADILTDVTQI